MGAWFCRGRDVYFICRTGAIAFRATARNAGDATRRGETLSFKALGRDYRLVIKNRRFVAGALALGFVNLPLLARIAQSPIIIISGEQLSSYEYGLLQVPFLARSLPAIVVARLTSRRTVRSLIADGRLAYRRGADHRRGGGGSFIPCIYG